MIIKKRLSDVVALGGIWRVSTHTLFGKVDSQWYFNAKDYTDLSERKQALVDLYESNNLIQYEKVE